MNRYDIVETNNGWFVTANTRMNELRDGKTYVFERADDLASFLADNLMRTNAIRACQQELP